MGAVFWVTAGLAEGFGLLIYSVIEVHPPSSVYDLEPFVYSNLHYHLSLLFVMSGVLCAFPFPLVLF